MQRIALTLLLCLTGSICTQSPLAQAKPAQDSHAQPVSAPAVASFEVATIKPAAAKPGRYITMQGTNRFIAKAYTLKLMIAAAYDLNPRTISGGPAWMESDTYDVAAVTPGDARPARDVQMSMLRTLLAERFKLAFHREQKDFSIYALEVAKSGPTLALKHSTAADDEPAKLVSTVHPQRIVLPARNATMQEFASILQRAILDRPVVDRTGLTGKYDFDLEWAPDETQFGGAIPAATADAAAPPFFTAVREQLGLTLTATRGAVSALVVDVAERPSAN